MITLFIDTNVVLSFYHLTSEDIEELEKVVALVEKKEIELIVPKQVENEFWRNRGASLLLRASPQFLAQAIESEIAVGGPDRQNDVPTALSTHRPGGNAPERRSRVETRGITCFLA